MWRRNFSSHSQGVAFVREVRNLKSSGFYPVYVGKTEIPESLFTEDIPPEITRLRNQPTWSIIHAGGARGWVPWDYKVCFHLSEMKPKPDKHIFQELCAELSDHYGNCAMIVNPDIFRKRQKKKSGNSIYPTSPLELLPMTCCPEVAESYGHKMLQIPMHSPQPSPLNIAWSSAKRFIFKYKRNYTETFYSEGRYQKSLQLSFLIDDALAGMTRSKWAAAVQTELGS